MVSRRHVVLAFAASPFETRLARAQSTRKRLVGILDFGSAQPADQLSLPFKRGMQELGYVEGKAIEFQHRGANGNMELVPKLTKELQSWGAEVLFVRATIVARAVQQTAPELPVVLGGGYDPVAVGIADSLAHPGHSVTGIVGLSDEIASKHIELIRDIAPHTRRAAVLYWASPLNEKVLATLRDAGKRNSIDVVGLSYVTPADVDSALSKLSVAKANALIALPGPNLGASLRAILNRAAQLRLPAVYSASEYVDAGGLLSYGPYYPDIYHRAATYVDKILKGAKPGDLPIEQPTKFELVINRKTAKALGITIPHAVFLRADRVIE